MSDRGSKVGYFTATIPLVGLSSGEAYGGVSNAGRHYKVGSS